MTRTRLASLVAAALCALPAAPPAALAAPTAPVVRELASQPPDVALLHSGHQSAGIHPVWYGRELATGDFNGDGKTDLAVSANYNSIGGDRSPGRGRVFVYFGKGGDFPSLVDPAELGADVSIEGPEPFAYFGTELAAGDFDGDGLDDLAVSALKLGDVYKGHVYVILGSVMRNSTEIRMDRTGYASHIEGRSNKISGYYSYFGFALAAGDFNGDGVDDLAAGAFGATGPGDALKDSGEVTIFLGRPVWRREMVADAGFADMIVYGGVKNYALGSELAAGDLNGDGRAELVAAAWAGAGPAGDRPFAGDVNVFDFASRAGVRLRARPGRKGRSWNVNLVPPSARIYGPAFNTRIGSSSSEGGGRSIAIGDVDGDGAPDVVIGSGFWGQPSPLKNPGKAWVVWGGEGLTRGARVDLASAESSFTAVAEGTGSDTLGDAVRVVDLDGDGRAEVILGAPDADEARGYVAIYRGRARPPAGSAFADGPDAVIVGRRAGWRAGDDVIAIDATFAGRALVGAGTTFGGFTRWGFPRGQAGQVDLVAVSALLP